MTDARAKKLGAAYFAAAAILACALGGCVETTDTMQTASIAASPQPVSARPGVSPSGATIAFASLEGAPPALSAGFRDQLTAAAASRDIATADGQSADYLVRGYLTAYPVAERTTIAFVWDVFDKQKRHATRIDDTVTVQQSAQNSWSLADPTVMANVAAKSADDLAAFLSNTPEAIAAAAQPPATLAVASAPAFASTTGGDTPRSALAYQ
jgi:hypothetical protein